MKLVSGTRTHSMAEFDVLRDAVDLAEYDYKALAHQLGEELIKGAFFSFESDEDFHTVRITYLVPDEQFWADLQNLLRNDDDGAWLRLSATLNKRELLVKRQRAEQDRIRREQAEEDTR